MQGMDIGLYSCGCTGRALAVYGDVSLVRMWIEKLTSIVESNPGFVADPSCGISIYFGFLMVTNSYFRWAGLSEQVGTPRPSHGI